jgi:hypothetical protein
MNTRLQTQTKAASAPSFAPVQTRLLQRKCACGSAAAAGECEKCATTINPKRLQGDHEKSSDSLQLVREVLGSQGTPLDSGTRAAMESHLGSLGRISALPVGSAPVDAQLRVGRANDPSEQEADRVATHLTSAPAARPARSPSYDFTRVRVHTDAQAAESARAVNALAYTVGNHVVFSAEQYAPRTCAGQRLLAHELTHVVQAVQGSHDGTVRRAPIQNAAGDFTSFEFRIGTELTQELAALAQKLAGDGKIDDADLGELTKSALDKRETVNDNERMFMAALMEPKNAKALKAAKLGPAASITFDFKTITKTNLQHIIDLNRQATPASVTKLLTQNATAAARKDYFDAIKYGFQAEAEASKQIMSNAGSFKTQATALIAFAQANGVFLNQVLRAMLAAASDNSDGDKVMAGNVYAVAAQAGNALKDDVLNGRVKVDAMSASAFAALPLPSHNMKAFYVTKAMPSGVKGDTVYLQTDINIADLNDRSTVIHELRHAEEDKAASTTDKLVLPGAHFPPEREMEARAYRAQARYILDQMAGKSATEQATSAKSVVAPPVNELVFVALVLEGKTNQSLYQPILEVIFDAAPPPTLHRTAAEVKRILALDTTKMAADFLAAIEKGYGMKTGQTGVVEGLSGESLIHFIFRF